MKQTQEQTKLPLQRNGAGRMSRTLIGRLAGGAAALLLAACAALPPGVPPAPANDDAAAVLTLPSGRSLPVDPGALSYTGRARMQWPDGRSYEGTWVDGLPDGHGIEIRPDGSRYVGEFRQGSRAGVGMLESLEGVYHGDWQDDLPEGDGVFQAADGARYEGAWLQGERFGQGTYTTPDGEQYSGDWAYDQPHGFGHLRSADGSQYRGEWSQGRQHGYGRAEGPAPQLVYEGTWAYGRKHGFGRETRPDGSHYEGDWVDGKRHGQGREVRADGTFHDGSWELNQALGPGRRNDTAGIEITGMWNGDTVSNGLLTLPTGAEYAGPLFSRANTVAAPMLLEWLQTTAERGDAYAALLLGRMHLDLLQPPPDLDKARHWLGLAAAAGIAEAQYRLALTFHEEAPERAVPLLSRAAEQHHAGANELLGDYYSQGIGVPRDLDTAIRHYQRAAQGGSNHARNNLAWLLATTADPDVRDGERALALIHPIALFLGDWQYLDTLAAAWAAAGEFDQAIVTAQQAMDEARYDPQAAGDDIADMARRLERYRAGQPYLDIAP
ncbi:MAG: hypothetical protein ACNA7W_03670 [Pseudomonadales bacterium]